MDYWIIRAEAVAEDGSRGILSCKFSERDSESTSDAECELRLQIAADNQNVKIIGPIEVVTDWEMHAKKDAERAARVAA